MIEKGLNDRQLLTDPVETQLTFGKGNFLINHTQCFSPDDTWIVYDTRNEDSQIIQTGTIGLLHVPNGQIEEIYHTENQTEYGPGVGAATFARDGKTVLFLHGLRNSNKDNPYGFARRTAVSVSIKNPFVPIFMDARNIVPPFTKGALRGGTHAHSFSGDGQWISFTYNDFVLEQVNKKNEGDKDLRTVGVMKPVKVVVTSKDGYENFSGEMFSAIVSEVTESPKWGSDEIEKAFDETWVGINGYIKENGVRQHRAIAFQGHVRDVEGNIKTEVFVVDLPEDISMTRPNKPLEGTRKTRPAVPAEISQRRITFLKFGVQGPRHWLRSKSDGTMIAFLMSDDLGLIQIFGISPNGGECHQITHQPYSIQNPFAFSPDDNWVAFIADNTIFIQNLKEGKIKKVSKRFSDAEKPYGGLIWSNSGNFLAYNRYVFQENQKFLHVFLLHCFH